MINSELLDRPLLFRLWHMFLGWGTVGLIYTLSGVLQGKGRVMEPSALDRMIAFSPHAVWLYMSFFIVVPLGYLLAPQDRVRWLSRSMRLTALGAGMVYMLWPTTLVYPVDQGSTLSSAMLVFLTWVDSSQNCLPSLHMALMVLAVWGISAARRTVRTVLFVLWVAVIAWSILQLRRHLFIDVLSGALLALFAGWMVQVFEKGRHGVLKGDLR
ncbi:phosphatase PAP2 family protein [Pseudomonas alliivorans]|nr:phosphatase PAP2 family protein [Pseudomonas alliivorans]MEE4677982.1 phosphatase PAP2 family protein [Pseudomonas alliivorans]MEE4683170.1 phosphatase PAP2 family protein [Pseudomonas alliivorans]MEE4704021.1 phosphatase PAP2 family protein [Pseudomonas alliivorans]MEE4739994.1 phosphatase PAP2 family protein [Pseudomonas alliivorans]